MKWYKRDSDYLSRPLMGELLDELGFKGIYVHNKTIEILAKNFDLENPGHFSCSFKWYIGSFPVQIRHFNLYKYLDFGKRHKLFTYEINGRKLIINCPEIKDLADEYTRKIIKGKEGKETESVRSKSRQGVRSSFTSTSSSKGKGNTVDHGKENLDKEDKKFWEGVNRD